MNTEQWCADDALMMRWWCADDALMMRWWCTDGALTIYRWYMDDSLNPLFKNIPHVGSFWHFVICCFCLFVYLYFCICAFGTWEYNFWYPWTILFSKIYYIMGLSGTSSFAVFVYLCISVFVFLYLCVWHIWLWFLISLNNPLFKNIPHVGSFWHLVICCICVFVYLYLCICVWDTW